MRTYILALCGLLLGHAMFGPMLSAQVVSMDYLLGTKQYVLEKYDTTDVGAYTYFLRCNYGSPEIINSDIYEQIKASSRAIDKIDMVYTGIALVDSFNQRRLNKNRLTELLELAPDIFDQSIIEWKFYKQVNDESRQENKKLFHGFVVHMQPDPPGMTDVISGERRIEELTSIMESVTPDTTIKKRSIRQSPYYLPIWKFKRDKGITYPTRGIWPRKAVYPPAKIVYDTTITMPGLDPRLRDSVVLATLHRNKGWRNFAVVQDVTGSMHPYLGQVFMWQSELKRTTDVANFIFFNDGDKHPDGPIGSSGGTYHIQSNDLGEVMTTAKHAMKMGYGGQAPENDIEALLFAAEKCPDCTSLVLVADNYALVRDMSLVSRLNLPVHVIACGTRGGNVNYQYIDLARRTGGSVHTMEEDLQNLAALKDGDELKVGRQTYRIVDDKLRLVR